MFVSHYFGEDDYPSTLVKVLRERNIAGYLAIKKKQYEIGIDQKIKDAILQSDYLVPILTNNGLGSPSVNQEIGFALGSGIPVIVMIEKETKKGVFIYGREPEEFTKEDFTESCQNVSDYLVREGKRKIKPSVSVPKPTLDFLTKRNLTNPDREEFTINPTSDKLHDATQKTPNYPNTYKRLVQFSACPMNLFEDIEVVSQATRDWIKANIIVTLDEFRYNIMPPTEKEKIGMNSLVYRWFTSGDNLRRYLEFQNNGYLEQGEIDPLIRNVHFRDDNNDPVIGLHLNWVIGAYWGFLLFARNYYKWRQIRDEIKVSLNIHNTDDLMLFGLGARIGSNEWTDPTRPYYDGAKLVTDEMNVQVANTINANTSDDEIAKLVFKASERLCNAYGLPQSRCYNDDGTFNSSLFSYYARIS